MRIEDEEVDDVEEECKDEEERSSLIFGKGEMGANNLVNVPKELRQPPSLVSTLTANSLEGDGVEVLSSDGDGEGVNKVSLKGVSAVLDDTSRASLDARPVSLEVRVVVSLEVTRAVSPNVLTGNLLDVTTVSTLVGSEITSSEDSDAVSPIKVSPRASAGGVILDEATSRYCVL